MDFKEWVELLGRVGGPVLGLLGVVWFLYKTMWPFIVARIEKAEASRDLEITRFTRAIEQNNELHAAAMEKLVGSLNALREEVIRRKD